MIEIDAPAYRFACCKSEDHFRPRSPDANDALTISEDHGLERLLNDRRK